MDWSTVNPVGPLVTRTRPLASTLKLKIVLLSAARSPASQLLSVGAVALTTRSSASLAIALASSLSVSVTVESAVPAAVVGSTTTVKTSPEATCVMSSVTLAAV